MKYTLKTLRVMNDKTQEDVAKWLNISRSAYANYERGKVPMNIILATKIADFYNVDINDIIFFKEKCHE